MKKLTLLLALLCSVAHADNVRWDSFATTTTGTGTYVPLLVIPGAKISYYTGCSSLPCVTKAVTYTSATGTTCASTTQVVLQLSTTCVNSADSQGNFGGWFSSGLYQYTITFSGVTYGPYNFNVGGSGGGSGTVNSGTAFGLTYYPSSGNSVSGATPFTGIPYVSTSAQPVAATSANVSTLLQTATGCSSAGYVYLPQSNTCVPISGVTSITTTLPLTASASTGPVTLSAQKTGAGTSFVTASAAGTTGNCATWNSGNVGDAGFPCSSGGSGSVTSVGSGNASPLFTTSVANSTTTPVISYGLSNVSAWEVFGRFAGSAGSPTYGSLTTEMLPYTVTGNTTLLISGSGSYVSGDCLQLNSALNAVDVTCPTSGAGPPASPIGSLQTNAGAGNLASYTTSGLVKVSSSSPALAVQGTDYLGSGLCTVTGASSITLDGSTCSNFTVTLGTNVATVTLTNFVTNQFYVIRWKEDGTGGRTCANPTGGVGFSGCSPDPNSKTDYFTQYDGTNLVAQTTTIH